MVILSRDSWALSWYRGSGSWESRLECVIFTSSFLGNFKPGSGHSLSSNFSLWWLKILLIAYHLHYFTQSFFCFSSTIIEFKLFIPSLTRDSFFFSAPHSWTPPPLSPLNLEGHLASSILPISKKVTMTTSHLCPSAWLHMRGTDWLTRVHPVLGDKGYFFKLICDEHWTLLDLQNQGLRTRGSWSYSTPAVYFSSIDGTKFEDYIILQTMNKVYSLIILLTQKLFVITVMFFF